MATSSTLPAFSRTGRQATWEIRLQPDEREADRLHHGCSGSISQEQSPDLTLDMHETFRFAGFAAVNRKHSMLNETYRKQDVKP